MAQVAGAIIVSIVVSKAVSTLGPKLGLSQSTSDMLGMAAAMYAGGQVGAGSTAGTGEAAAATSSQVGADIPAGYGGATAGAGASNIAGTPLAPAGSAYASPQSAGYGAPAGTGAGAGSAAMAGPARAGSYVPPSTFQAPAPGATGQPAQITGAAGDVQQPLVDVPGRGVEGPPSQLPSERAGGMLSEGVQAQQPGVAPGTAATPDTASQVIQQETVGRTAGGTGEGAETNWWKRMFTPEKTMDLAIAGMQGYAEAGMRQEEMEYADKVATRDADEWGRAYGTRVNSLNQSYPSGYQGP